jgi:Pyruvate dehydrogenase E1 component middle domain
MAEIVKPIGQHFGERADPEDRRVFGILDKVLVRQKRVQRRLERMGGAPRLLELLVEISFGQWHRKLLLLSCPHVPDESRTFGMEGMFRQFGIFSQVGQLYRPEDAKQLMFYKEDRTGRMLQEDFGCRRYCRLCGRRN